MPSPRSVWLIKRLSLLGLSPWLIKGQTVTSSRRGEFGRMDFGGIVKREDAKSEEEMLVH